MCGKVVSLCTHHVSFKKSNVICTCKFKCPLFCVILSKFACLHSLPTVHVRRASVGGRTMCPHNPLLPPKPPTPPPSPNQPPVNCDQLTKTTNRLPEPLLHKKVHSEPELVGGLSAREGFPWCTRFCHGAGALLVLVHGAPPSCIPSQPGISNSLTIMPTLQNFPPIWAAPWIGLPRSRPPTGFKWRISISGNTKGCFTCQIGRLCADKTHLVTFHTFCEVNCLLRCLHFKRGPLMDHSKD